MNSSLKWVIGTIACCFLALVSCSDDKEDVDDSFKVYFSSELLGWSEKEVDFNESLTFHVGDSFELSIESVYDSIWIIATQEDIEIESSGYNKYSCITKSSGETDIVFVPFSDEMNNNGNWKDIYYLHCNIKGLQYTYLILENMYTIHVNNSIVLENEIREELQNSYPLLSTLELQYVTLDTGDFQFINKAKGDTFDGTFSMDGSSLSLFYDNSVRHLQIEETDANRFNLIQELTGHFREKYPTADIETVCLTSSVLRN